jgi:hypothetical protein
MRVLCLPLLVFVAFVVACSSPPRAVAPTAAPTLRPLISTASPTPRREPTAPRLPPPTATIPGVPGAPVGATARCNDGTYSFSTRQQGTCSDHGGVAQFLEQLPP